VAGIVLEKSDNADSFTSKERACIQRTIEALPLPCPFDDASRRLRLAVEVTT
jgi:hypothetical protein